jgi:general secretion pathway protein K
MIKRQAGVAVITALLLTTLAISIVASLFWQQQVQVRSMENQRLQLQTKWILRGALDWAMLVLNEDASSNKYTSLDQVWATPLADTRLDQYIERERVQGENFDATLSGSVVDATSRYNLNNLADAGQPLQDHVDIFARLLKNLQLNPALAKTAAQYVARSQAPMVQSQPGPPPSGTPPQQQRGTTTMKLVQLEDLLAIQGFTPEMIEKLRPFALVLPKNGTTVNVNTAPAEVLAALVPNYSVMQANSLVEQRKRAPWNDIQMFATQVGAGATVVTATAAVKSDWFLVQSHIKLDRATLNVEALVSRGAKAPFSSRAEVEWIRQI